MKRAISFTLVFIMLATIISGCSFLPEDIVTFVNVNFYVDNEIYATKSVMLGQTVSQPTNPEKENQIFLGWYVDGIFTYEYDFSSKVISNLDLYAKFTLDAISLTNMITTSTMKSLISINNKCYNTAMGGLLETSSSTAQGSGVIIDISGGYAYALTNFHVIEIPEGYSHQSITVEDPWGNEYQAYIYKNPYSSDKAMDASYDLALVYFEYNNIDDLKLAEIEIESDPKIGDFVISLGSPLGQKNSITYGSVLSYQKLNYEDETDENVVLFEIIYHNALLYRGSSGGPLLNSSGKLVGLNFAGFENNHYGCAIPVSKIIEFLDKYVYIK